MLALDSTEAILLKSEELSLYKKLLLQLNKDFLRANLSIAFIEDISPNDLKIQMHQIVTKLINEQFSEYLNLLYIIDVSEDKIKQLQVESPSELIAQNVYLILLREWQKVWFKESY